jgi:hypothetical protein
VSSREKFLTLYFSFVFPPNQRSPIGDISALNIYNCCARFDVLNNSLAEHMEFRCYSHTELCNRFTLDAST